MFKFLAIFFYLRDLNGTIIYINMHTIEISVIIIITFFMLYSTGLVSYYRRRARAWTSLNVLQTMWLSFLSLSVAYAISTLFFYSTRISRGIFFYNFLLLSIFFVLNMEHFLKHYIRKTNSYVWLCENLTPQELKSEYSIHIENIKYNFSSDATSEKTIIIYDNPKIEEDRIIDKIIRGFTVIPVSHLIELEAGIVPLIYINKFYRISDFTSTKYFTDGFKTIMDYVIAPILLLLLLPIASLFAILQIIESPGPIFYKQLRTGKYGKPFHLIKFRTMIKDAEKRGKKYASKRDPRVTKIGRIMRKLRLDEVPQLFNIIRGEMSLIGPRPEIPEYVEKFSKRIQYYKLRLEVKPGLTGWAQVHYKYTGPDLKEQIRRLEYDLYYLKNRSILLEIIILIKTIGVIMKAEGV